MEPNKESTSKEVLNKIKKGELKKRSRLYFVLKHFFWILGIALIVIFSVFLGSFIFFILRATGALFLPIFGFLGFKLLISSFPWVLIIILISLILLIEGLVKKSSFVYRNPLLYSIILIFLLVLIGSFILGRAKFHTVFFKEAQENRLPVMGSVYRGFGLKPIKNAYIAKVLELNENGFTVETKSRGKFNIIVSKDTHFPLEKDIKIGDLVMVMGGVKNGEILAIGIRKIEDIDNLYWDPMNHKPLQRLGPSRR